ncbi:hypothetical protein GCM10022631_38970 [Deinococcus rubellus]|uniref:Uncharacterized protein n=1 Tax=Deinococcus rubellus TaxID=1889240 RepID=A0ABY5YD88_9DEIO|nr:hypothetical protein [Deinococcus rubellus]UWX63035.1 hypothetical protein N0D28_09695 [Deinococcus rubellus]
MNDSGTSEPKPAALLAAQISVTDRLGQPVKRELSARERWLATQAETALHAAQALTPGTTLSRLEINGMLPDTSSSYLYLRYQPDANQPATAPQEFWACFRRRASFDQKRGLIGVPSALAPA